MLLATVRTDDLGVAALIESLLRLLPASSFGGFLIRRSRNRLTVTEGKYPG